MSFFVRLLERGESVTLCKRNVPIATVVPIPEPPKIRPIGLFKGLFKVPDDAWAPMTDEELKDWYGESN